MQHKKPAVLIWQKLINDIFSAVPMTQRQFAKEIGVAHNSIHGWLNGRNKPRPEFQLVIVEYCMTHRLNNLCKKYKLANLIAEVKRRRCERLVGVPNDDDYYYI